MLNKRFFEKQGVFFPEHPTVLTQHFGWSVMELLATVLIRSRLKPQE